MFRWYKGASKCYVYLSDVSSSALDADEEVSLLPCEADFKASRWFTRGWTLQELLAPPSVEFFSREGNCIGDKASLGQLIHDITSIDVQALYGAPLEQFDVEKRFSWAKGRQTMRKEDEAYSLLGIFDVYIPLIYGEAGRAMQRLREEIDRHSNHQHAAPTRASSAKFIVPYAQNVDFIERPRIMKDLKEQLGYGQPQELAKPRSRVSLYGLGGAGKTQIALAYADWLRKECPDMSVFWVHASNEARFRESFTSIAKGCGIPGYDDPNADDILPLVKSWLETKDCGRWLMVIDNADDTQLFFPSPQEYPDAHPADPALQAGLGQYIPQCEHGFILVTTRNKQAGSWLTWGSPPIEVGRMTDSEAHQLMRTKLAGAEITVEETRLLSFKLENLPLALAQAAAFIQEKCTTINRYIQLLDQSDNELVNLLSKPFQAVGRDSDTPHAVTATWIISFEQIEQQNAFTGEVLSLISLFDRQAIPIDFVADYYRKTRSPELQSSEAGGELTDALGTLKAFSLILDGENECADMHRLVQLVTRKWLVRKGKMPEFAQCALEIVSSAFPYWKFEHREICTQYLPHAIAVLENNQTVPTAENIEGANLQAKMAATYWQQGQYSEAEALDVQVLALYKQALGPDHPDTLRSMGGLAATYRQQGRYSEAEALDVQVLALYKQALGPDHPDTLRSMGGLAATYWQQGRYSEAEALDVQVLALYKQALGPDHPDTLRSMGGLAATYWQQGRYSEAEALDVQVLALYKQALGPDHPDTLRSMGGLAATYWQQGRYSEAEALQVQVLALRKQALGPDHPDTQSTSQVLQYWLGSTRVLHPKHQQLKDRGGLERFKGLYSSLFKRKGKQEKTERLRT